MAEGIRPVSYFAAADNRVEDNEVSNDGGLAFIAGNTLSEFKSKENMTIRRRKIVDSFLRLGKKREGKVILPVDRSELSSVSEIRPSVSYDPAMEKRIINNKIAQQRRHKNLEIRNEKPEKNNFSEFSENRDNITSEESIFHAMEKRKINNKIAQQKYRENLKIKSEEPKENNLSEVSENRDNTTSNETIVMSSLDSGVAARRNNPLISVDQNPPCNTLYVGNLTMDASEDELKSLFMRQIGYKRICFRTKQNGPMCFVEFDDTQSATEALQHNQGYQLSGSTKEGIRLSYSKNPLGVRSERSARNPLTVAPQARPEGEHKIIGCVCGAPNNEEYVFQCEDCGKWQHVQCYHDLVLSNEELHECLDCSLKQREEPIKNDSYENDREGFDSITSDSLDVRQSKKMTFVRPSPLRSYLDHQKRKVHQKTGNVNSTLVSPPSNIRVDAISSSVPSPPKLPNWSPTEIQKTAMSRQEGLIPHLKLEDRTDEENTVDICPCGCIVQNELQSQLLPEFRTTLEDDWNLIQCQLPEEWKWDTEYHNGCWTCTPLETTTQKNYPLTIGGAPVVLPVEYQWPPISGVTPPPDPRPLTPIDYQTELSLEIVRDLFLTFEGSVGFYVLINGLLQVIVPDNFDTSWASSHLPHKYGGLKVCYIPQTIEPTMRQSTTQISETDPSISSFTSSAVDVHWPGRSLHNSWSDSLKLNDFLEARPKSKSRKEKYSGRIGLKVIKDGDPYLVMSTHVITEAILAKSHLEAIFGSTRNRIERLSGDWNEFVEMWAGGSKIGTIRKSFDCGIENYPNGFNHDVTLIKATALASIRDITSPISDIGWLNRDSWNSLRQQTSAVKILAPTENHRAAKSLKCSRLSEILIVGEGIFLNQKAALGSTKNLKDHDVSAWRDLVSRAVLYRVFPDFDPPNGYSGIALYADGTREDGTEGPGIVGFQSFVQRSGHVQNFEMEGVPLEQRLKLGRVAFYGAFEVPAELKGYTIV